MKEAREFIMKCVFILTACVSIAAVVLICIFMFANGIPAMETHEQYFRYPADDRG